MAEENPIIDFSFTEAGEPQVLVNGDPVTTIAALVERAQLPGSAERLLDYCLAVNHLTHGFAYRLIENADDFREKYAERLRSEDPQAPWQEGTPQLSDFGVCDTSEIREPRIENGQCIFFVEDDFLGIPYRVVAPDPAQPEGQATYEPLPMAPLSES